MRPSASQKIRAGVMGALLLPLAACLGGGGAMGGASKPAAEAPRQVAFFDGDVIVAGPMGYCVDPDSVQRKGNDRFALLAGCVSLGRTFADKVTPAVVTVSVLPQSRVAQQPTADRLAAPWAHAGVLRKIEGDGLSLVQLARGGDALLPGGDPRHWRGAMMINGHMIGFAAYGGAGSAVAGEAGRNVLIATAKAMRAASPQQTPPQSANE